MQLLSANTAMLQNPMIFICNKFVLFAGARKSRTNSCSQGLRLRRLRWHSTNSLGSRLLHSHREHLQASMHHHLVVCQATLGKVPRQVREQI